MNRSLSFEKAVVRHPARGFSPERLAVLRNIFETVCDEAAIPLDAERRQRCAGHQNPGHE